MRRGRGRTVPRITPWASQIAESGDFSNQYVGSPNFMIDGSVYWASHGWGYGDATPRNQTLIYKSTDYGATWSLVRTITGCFWAKLLLYNGDHYLIGVHERDAVTSGGNLVIFKSTDDWATAPSSTTVFTDFEYTTHAAAVVIDSGYLLYPTTTRATTSFADGFELVLCWADLTDLMTSGNWGKSNRLAYSQVWNDPGWHATNSGWLEPSIVNDGGTIKMLARHHNTVEHKGCLIDVTWTPATPTASLSFNDATGFKDVPGGSIQFVPIWHATSSKWVIICNHRSVTIGDPNDERDEQYLYATSDFETWTQIKQLHGQVFEKTIGEGITKDGFQYSTGEFSADDNTLHYVTRTSWRGANDQHDANRLTYDFVPNMNAILA